MVIKLTLLASISGSDTTSLGVALTISSTSFINARRIIVRMTKFLLRPLLPNQYNSVVKDSVG